MRAHFMTMTLMIMLILIGRWPGSFEQPSTVMTTQDNTMVLNVMFRVYAASFHSVRGGLREDQNL